MARVYTDGAENGDVLFFDGGYAGITASTLVARSGNYSYRCANVVWGTKTITPVSEGYWRFSFYRNDVSQGARIFYWYSDATELGSLRIQATTNKLEAYRSQIDLAAVGSLALSPNTQYIIEIYVKIADSGGSIKVKIDGLPTLDIDYTGDTKPGTQTTINSVRYTQPQNSSAVYYFDDLAMNDTTGSVDNSWCGDGRVIILPTNDDGDVTMLIPSSGIDNWAMVDEIPNDGDTTYVMGSGINDYDLYTLSDSSLADVNILRVWPASTSRKTIATPGKLAFMLKTNGVEYTQSGLDLLTSYARVTGSGYIDNPQTGVDWTISELDALQVGIKIVE